MSGFARRLMAWRRRHGRRGLPWQRTRDPYRIWLAEVMLQQTQVAAVIPYYERFLKKFPTVEALADADENDVLRLWSGLGYYARARNLLAASKLIVRRGRFPDTLEEIEALPGVGRSTAGAIAAFAFGQRAAILDGNAKRVIARRFGVEGENRQWDLAARLLPARGIEAYTQALMDLGATVCTRANPACARCPVSADCVARREGRIDELPARRPRRPVPLRRATWLVLLHKHQVLMERRPVPGIWGGLWSFPEATVKQVASYCRLNFGCDIKATRKLKAIEHGFTHFRLRAQPILCPVTRAAPRAESPGRFWLDLEEAAGAAVPVPVRRLLAQLSAARRPRPG